MEEQTAMRMGDYKLVLNGRLTEDQPARAPVFLSDLRTDPGETENLASVMPELCAEMTQIAMHWRDGIEKTWNEKFASNYKLT